MDKEKNTDGTLDRAGSAVALLQRLRNNLQIRCVHHTDHFKYPFGVDAERISQETGMTCNWIGDFSAYDEHIRKVCHVEHALNTVATDEPEYPRGGQQQSDYARGGQQSDYGRSGQQQSDYAPRGQQQADYSRSGHQQSDNARHGQQQSDYARNGQQHQQQSDGARGWQQSDYASSGQHNMASAPDGRNAGDCGQGRNNMSDYGQARNNVSDYGQGRNADYGQQQNVSNYGRNAAAVAPQQHGLAAKGQSMKGKGGGGSYKDALSGGSYKEALSGNIYKETSIDAGEIRVCRYDYIPKDSDKAQISLRTDDLVRIFESTPSGWSAGVRLNRDTMQEVGEAGWFPAEYLQPLEGDGY